MISEKTVELNLTTELVNWMYVRTSVRPFILAPSQAQEGTLGFDAAVGFPGIARPYLLQYKRAEFRVRKNEYLYHLNHTARQDQHLRLYLLERLGWDVFYALPLFHTEVQVINHRQRLLPKTLYIRPSSMIPAGGVPAMVGHHEVRHNLTTNITTIHSDEGVEITSILNHKEFIDILQNASIRNSSEETLNRFFDDFNRIFANTQALEFDGQTLDPQSESDPLAFSGLSALMMPVD